MSRVEAGFGFVPRAKGLVARKKRSVSRFCGCGRGDPHRLESPPGFFSRGVAVFKKRPGRPRGRPDLLATFPPLCPAGKNLQR
jgi:hypothetical protein